MSRDDTFLDRWARRKQAVAAEEAPNEAELPEEQVNATPDLSEEEVLEKLGLPDPETMKEGDDFAAFLKDGVPDFLRRKALRKLWLSNPALANLDGLLEYGEDYTDAAMVPEVINTLYQVGKGMLRETLDPDAVEDEGESVPDEIAQESELAEPEEAPELDVETPSTEEDIKIASKDYEIEEEIVEYRPRRMRFSTG